MFFAATTFFASLAGIVALFYVKHLELRSERILTPTLKEVADGYALNFKELLARSRSEIAKVVPITVFLMRLAVREAALQSAALLQFGERKAQELADLVSHKHRFERRETKSDFLRHMGGHPFRSAINSNSNVRTSAEPQKPLDISRPSNQTSTASITPVTPLTPQKRERKTKHPPTESSNIGAGAEK